MKAFWAGYFVGVVAALCLGVAFPLGAAWGFFLGFTVPPIMACVFVVAHRDN